MATQQVSLSAETLEVLKNYATINSNFAVSAGNTIRTLAANNRQLLSKYECEETWPVDFAIYDLPQFLRCLDTFDKPAIEFDLDGSNKCKLVSEDTEDASLQGYNTSIDYTFAEREVLVCLPRGDADPGWNAEFDMLSDFVLDKRYLQHIVRTAGILSLPYIQFRVDANDLATVNVESLFTGTGIGNFHQASDNSVSIALEAPTPATKAFKGYWKTDNLVQLKKDYVVTITEKRGIRFESLDGKLTYWQVFEELDFEGDE